MSDDDEDSRGAAASPGEPISWNDLLRGLRHELRTPINHIIGYSELLLEEAAEGGYLELLPDLQRIRTAGRHLLSQVHALLDLAEDLGDAAPQHPDDRSIPSAPATAVGISARPPSVQ